MDATHAQNRIALEWNAACDKFPTFNSAHEGWAVLHEEMRELEDEVFWGAKGKTEREWKERMADEAVQVAAMALRFLCDVC